MKICCPSCGVQGRVDRTRLAAHNWTVRCPRCRERFVLAERLKDPPSPGIPPVHAGEEPSVSGPGPVHGATPGPETPVRIPTRTSAETQALTPARTPVETPAPPAPENLRHTVRDTALTEAPQPPGPDSATTDRKSSGDRVLHPNCPLCQHPWPPTGRKCPYCGFERKTD